MADIGVEETLYKKIDTGNLSGGYTYTTDFNREVKISSVMVTSTGTWGNNDDIDVYFDSATGPNYDTLVARQDMKFASNFVWYPDGELYLTAGDELRIELPADSGETAYITVIARQA